jgi:hypothetical protein
MKLSNPRALRGLCALALALAAAPSMATDWLATPVSLVPLDPLIAPSLATDAVPASTDDVVPAPQDDAGVQAIGAAVPSTSLESLRGGDGNVNTTNVADLRGRVDGNTASNVVTGGNVVQDGSFANASGISTVIQNSGNNVLIQNGTVVNVQFAGPGQ